MSIFNPVENIDEILFENLNISDMLGLMKQNKYYFGKIIKTKYSIVLKLYLNNERNLQKVFTKLVEEGNLNLLKIIR